MIENTTPEPLLNIGENKTIYGRNFSLLIFGRLVSNLGSTLFNFALSLYVLDITGSAAQFSLILGFSFLPQVLVNLLGGVWVDKNNKKWIIVLSDLASGMAVLIFMAVFGYFPKSIAIFVCYVLILNSCQAFFGMAMNAAIPNLVNFEKVPQINSIMTAITAICNIAGPVAGAFMYKTFGMQMVFGANGIALILAGALEICLIYRPASIVARESKSYLQDIKVTFEYLNEHRILGFLFIFAIIINFMYNALIFLVLPYINYHVIKVSGFQMSLIQAFGALGVILGGVFVSTRSDHTGVLKKFFTLFKLQAVLIILWAFPVFSIFIHPDKWLITIIFSVLLIIYGGMNTIQNIPMISYFQVQIPEEIRGRLFGVFWAALFATTPLGLWLYGAILSKMPWVYVTCASGVLMIVIGIVFSGHRYFKEFTTGLNSQAASLAGENIPSDDGAAV